jgi:membrane protein YqaA with SNARE-associated domain
MLRKMYRRVMVLAASPHAPWWLALIAFAESSFFPIPPDAILVPMALAKPRQAWRFALICTVASVAGGALGYFIGYTLFDQVLKPILDSHGYGEKFAAFQAWYAEWGLAVILIKGLTPIPYKIVTIASGAAKFNFWVFMASSLVTRGGRFFLETTLLHFRQRHPILVSCIAVALILGTFVALKLL